MWEKGGTEVTLSVQACKHSRMLYCHHGLAFSVIPKSTLDSHRALLLLTAHSLHDSSLCIPGCPLYGLDTHILPVQSSLMSLYSLWSSDNCLLFPPGMLHTKGFLCCCCCKLKKTHRDYQTASGLLHDLCLMSQNIPRTLKN